MLQYRTIVANDLYESCRYLDIPSGTFNSLKMTLRLTVKHFWIIPSVFYHFLATSPHIFQTSLICAVSYFFINAQLYLSVSIYVFALILPIRIFPLLTILYMLLYSLIIDNAMVGDILDSACNSVLFATRFWLDSTVIPLFPIMLLPKSLYLLMGLAYQTFSI